MSEFKFDRDALITHWSGRLGQRRSPSYGELFELGTDIVSNRLGVDVVESRSNETEVELVGIDGRPLRLAYGFNFPHGEANSYFTQEEIGLLQLLEYNLERLVLVRTIRRFEEISYVRHMVRTPVPSHKFRLIRDSLPEIGEDRWIEHHLKAKMRSSLAITTLESFIRTPQN